MKSCCILVLSWTSVAALSLCYAGIAAAQETPAPASTAPTRDAQQGAPAALRLTLEDALARARKNSTQFQAAQTDAGLARGEQSLARGALLPNVNYNTQYLYTQGNGPGNPVRYIANNAVHEYISQGNVHQILDLASISNFRRVSAVAAAATRASGSRLTRTGRYGCPELLRCGRRSTKAAVRPKSDGRRRPLLQTYAGP